MALAVFIAAISPIKCMTIVLQLVTNINQTTRELCFENSYSDTKWSLMVLHPSFPLFFFSFPNFLSKNCFYYSFVEPCLSSLLSLLGHQAGMNVLTPRAIEVLSKLWSLSNKMRHLDYQMAAWLNYAETRNAKSWWVGEGLYSTWPIIFCI